MCKSPTCVPLLLPFIPLGPITVTFRVIFSYVIANIAHIRSCTSQADQIYKKWSPTLQQLAYQAFQMPRVRRNLCNMVVVLDPTTISGAEAMAVRG